jgi:hypothetical protein
MARDVEHVATRPARKTRLTSFAPSYGKYTSEVTGPVETGGRVAVDARSIDGHGRVSVSRPLPVGIVTPAFFISASRRGPRVADRFGVSPSRL